MWCKGAFCFDVTINGYNTIGYFLHLFICFLCVCVCRILHDASLLPPHPNYTDVFIVWFIVITFDLIHCVSITAVIFMLCVCVFLYFLLSFNFACFAISCCYLLLCMIDK